MEHFSQGQLENLCAIYMDMGTTNTRAWLLQGERLVAAECGSFGVRDTARDGSSTAIHQGLQQLIAKVKTAAIEQKCSPLCVAAAGMIGSSLGLQEIEHVAAPAGLAALASAARWIRCEEASDLPILIVPEFVLGRAITQRIRWIRRM